MWDGSVINGSVQLASAVACTSGVDSTKRGLGARGPARCGEMQCGEARVLKSHMASDGWPYAVRHCFVTCALTKHLCVRSMVLCNSEKTVHSSGSCNCERTEYCPARLIVHDEKFDMSLR